MKIFLSPDIQNKAIVYYTLQLIAMNKNVVFEYVTEITSCDVSIGFSEQHSIQLSENFFQLLNRNITNTSEHLNQQGVVINPLTQRIDFLSTIFYYTNCVQEYFTNSKDDYGRFPLENSIQFKLSIVAKNFVQELIEDFCEHYSEFKHLKGLARRSSIFLTHDIDFLFKGKNEDGMFALRNRKWLSISKLLYNHYLGTPDWLNIAEILSLEQAFNYTSTFFWLAIQNESNADYNIKSKKILNQLEIVKSKGHSNGIHKAMADTSFTDELIHFPDKVLSNRYHFLKFSVEDFCKIEEAGIQLDTSLGFSKSIGFRNSYGLPFMPFNLTQSRVLDFIEVPMQVMDRTLFSQTSNASEAENFLFEWLEQNLSNSVITINWHNNFFTDLTYKGYKEIYIKILNWVRDNNLKVVTEKDLIRTFQNHNFFSIPDRLKY